MMKVIFALVLALVVAFALVPHVSGESTLSVSRPTPTASPEVDICEGIYTHADYQWKMWTLQLFGKMTWDEAHNYLVPCTRSRVEPGQDPDATLPPSSKNPEEVEERAEDVLRYYLEEAKPPTDN